MFKQELNSLLNHIVSTARQITNAEAGRLYVLDQTKRYLYLQVSQNELIPVSIEDLRHISLNNMENICAYCAFSGKLINIANIYHYSGFDTSDIYEYDQKIGYKTQSLLTVPLRSYANITSGILQLINYHPAEKIQPFPQTLENLVKAFASQAAVALDNVQLIKENSSLIKLLETENIELKRKIAKQSNLRDAFIGDSAALPENLLESELFGYKRGAFSGANKDKTGLIEAADNGTLFLDEIGDMPINLQAKLLRVLQEKQIRPLGSLENKIVNLRIITATHCKLETLIKEGQFREDLYYRLNVFPIELPPLRARKDDIPALLQHFLKEYAKRYNKSLPNISPAAFDILLRYDYPGNVRELKNIIERAILLCSGNNIMPKHLDKKLTKHRNLTSPTRKLKQSLQNYEKQIIQKALKSNQWNQTLTAKELDISRRSLVGKISFYKLTN